MHKVVHKEKNIQKIMNIYEKIFKITLDFCIKMRIMMIQIQTNVRILIFQQAKK